MYGVVFYLMWTEHLEGVMTSLTRVQSLMKMIRNEQDYYRTRVHRHVQSKLQGSCKMCF